MQKRRADPKRGTHFEGWVRITTVLSRCGDTLALQTGTTSHQCIHCPVGPCLRGVPSHVDVSLIVLHARPSCATPAFVALRGISTLQPTLYTRIDIKSVSLSLSFLRYYPPCSVLPHVLQYIQQEMTPWKWDRLPCLYWGLESANIVIDADHSASVITSEGSKGLFFGFIVLM
jgi:hypothetical protein